MDYINFIKAKTHLAVARKSETPVLSEEDEQFLNRIISEDSPAPLRTVESLGHGGDAQIALMDGAQNIALPVETPDEVDDRIIASGAGGFPGTLDVSQKEGSNNKQIKTWSWLRRDSREAKTRREIAADSLHDLAQEIKTPDAKPNEDGIVADEEAKKEEEDMTVVLETLNLAAVNNRVFSISDDTQELLQRFNEVLQDLIRGVPTAYDDLEKLLTNGDRQLQKTYSTLPTFLQKLIEKLPDTLTKTLTPEILAAAAARAGQSGVNMNHAGKAAGMASKILKTPSLKDLVAKPSAIVGMLRSIITFLRARFPAFMGMNVLWSLAMFVLLFVFWYCYKRGREVRLDRERDLTEQEIQRLDAEYKSAHPGVHTTTAAPGAPIADVQAGIQEVETARAAAAAAAVTAQTADGGQAMTESNAPGVKSVHQV